jgi:hypothetical protein
MKPILQSTQVDVRLGPFIDSTDFKTPLTTLTYSSAGLTVTAIKNDLSTVSVTLSGVAGDGYFVHVGDGHYALTLPASALGVLGGLSLSYAATGALPGWTDAVVLPPNVFNALYGTDYVEVDVQEVAASVIALLQADLATSTALADVGSNVTTLSADVTTLSNSVDLIGDAVDAVDDSVTSVSTGVSSLLARLGAWTGTGVNTVLGAIKSLASKIATVPSDIGGTFSPATDSLEALAEAGGTAGGGGTGALPTTLVSVSDFKTWVGLRGRDLGTISDATILVALTNAVSVLEDMCNRKLEPDAEPVTVAIDGNDSEYLFIPESLEVDEVLEDGVSLTEITDYTTVPSLDLPLYALRRAVSGAVWTLGSVYTVTLTRGYKTPVPSALTEAAYRLAEGRTVSAPDEGIKSVSVQGVSVSLVSESAAEQLLESLVAPHVWVI